MTGLRKPDSNILSVFLLLIRRLEAWSLRRALWQQREESYTSSCTTSISFSPFFVIKSLYCVPEGDDGNPICIPSNGPIGESSAKHRDFDASHCQLNEGRIKERSKKLREMDYRLPECPPCKVTRPNSPII